jgi:hypothetical protein
VKEATLDDPVQRSMIQKSRLNTTTTTTTSSSSKSEKCDNPEIDSKCCYTFLDQSETKAVDYESDLYNLSNCIHQLLYFDNLSTVVDCNGTQMPRTKLKRYWNQDLWTEVFTVLLNSTSDTSKVRSEAIERLLDRMQQELTAQLDSRKFNVSLFIYFDYTILFLSALFIHSVICLLINIDYTNAISLSLEK